MNEYVKDFIESNIELIEQKDYVAFFTSWVHENSGVDGALDFLDLRHAFVECGIWYETESARKTVVCEIADAIVSRRISRGQATIDLGEIMALLETTLGLGEDLAAVTIIEYFEQEYDYDPEIKRFTLQ